MASIDVFDLCVGTLAGMRCRMCCFIPVPYYLDCKPFWPRASLSCVKNTSSQDFIHDGHLFLVESDRVLNG